MKNKIQVYDTVPDGWRIIEGSLTAPVGYTWISNGKSRFSKQYKAGLVKINAFESRDANKKRRQFVVYEGGRNSNQ